MKEIIIPFKPKFPAYPVKSVKFPKNNFETEKKQNKDPIFHNRNPQSSHLHGNSHLPININAPKIQHKAFQKYIYHSKKHCRGREREREERDKKSTCQDNFQNLTFTMRNP